MTNKLYVFFILCLFAGCEKTPNNSESVGSKTVSSQSSSRSAELVKMKTAANSSVSDTNPDEDGSARIARLVALGESDLAAAMIWIEANTPAQQQDGLKIAVVQEICINKLDLLPACLRYIKSSDYQKGIVKFVSSEWARRDPVFLAKFASEKLTGDFKNYAINEAVSRLSKTNDYNGAAKIVELMPYSSKRSEALSEIAFRWGGGDIEGAMAWAKKLELPEEKLATMKVLVNKLGELKDAERLSSLANEETSKDLQHLTIWNLANVLAQKDGAESTASWVKTLPADLQSEAQNAVVRKYAEGDLAQFTKYIATVDADTQISAVATMSSKLAGANPIEAAKWVLSLPEGDPKNMGISSLVGRWYNVDSIQLSEWVNTLKRGPIRDIALESLVSHMRDTDPKAAIDVAKQIDNPQKRLSLLQSVSAQK